MWDGSQWDDGDAYDEHVRRMELEREGKAALDERIDHLPVALRAASRAVDRLLTQLLRQGRLTGLPLTALALVVVRRGPAPVVAVAQRVGVSQQAASRPVTALEREGLVEKEPSYLDSRVRLVFVTEDGRRLLEELRHDLFEAVTVSDSVGEEALVGLTDSLHELGLVRYSEWRTWW